MPIALAADSISFKICAVPCLVDVPRQPLVQLWSNLLQELQSFSAYLHRKISIVRDVPAKPRETSDKPLPTMSSSNVITIEIVDVTA